jgi:hypothetical protein
MAAGASTAIALRNERSGNPPGVRWLEGMASRAKEPGTGATAAQLKADIDSGLTGDKVGGFDPSAAPLGTDEEAGGAPHDPELIARMRAQERMAPKPSTTAHAATPELQPDARIGRRTALAVPILVGVLAAAALAVLFVLAL